MAEVYLSLHALHITIQGSYGHQLIHTMSWGGVGFLGLPIFNYFLANIITSFFLLAHAELRVFVVFSLQKKKS